MNKTMTIAALSFGMVVAAQAASMTTTWTGAAGDGNFDTAGNWSNGVPARANNQGPDIIFTDAGTISGSICDTSDGGSLTVTGVSDVTLEGGRWVGNVTVGLGSVLTKGQTDFKNAYINVDGILNLSVAGNDSDASYNTLTFGTSGAMNVTAGALWSSSHFTVNALLNTEDTSMLTGTYRLETRTLIYARDGFYNAPLTFGTFSTANGEALTSVSSALTEASAANLGQYYVYTEGAYLNVQYVVAGTATPAVPEPATATLSLLALAGLAARRRRK